MMPVLCIAGPTASGKSAWAISLAKRFDGEIINADAMQVYRDLNILSARPSVDEMASATHHMFGHVDGQVRYSVGQWQKDVQPIILGILARGKLPIFVGGTGLYFKALTQGLANIPMPDADAKLRAHSLLESKGIGALRNAAERLDPVASARVLGNDPQRLLRIVSVALGTAMPLSDWQKNTRPVIPKQYWIGVKLLPERAGLYTRINQRFDRMVKHGGLEEVKALSARQLPLDLPVMKAIGVPQLLPSLSGETQLETALDLAKRDTRRFAKRQFTWLRGNMSDWDCVMNARDKDGFTAKLEEVLFARNCL